MRITCFRIRTVFSSTKERLFSRQTGEILPIARSEYGKLSSIYFDQGENEYYIAVAEGLPSNLTGLVLVGKTIYFTANFGNGLFSYGIDDGKATLLTPLNYPISLVAMSW